MDNMENMDKQEPVPEFMTGCFTGFVYILLMGVAVAIGIALLNAPVPASSVVLVKVVFPLGLCILILLAAIHWIRRTIRSFRDGSTYYGSGLLVFFLIPLLFFGVCTMTGLR